MIPIRGRVICAKPLLEFKCRARASAASDGFDSRRYGQYGHGRYGRSLAFKESNDLIFISELYISLKHCYCGVIIDI